MSKVVEDAAFVDACDICGQRIRAKTQRGLNQGMGVHKRNAHDVIGKGKALTTRRDRELMAGSKMTPSERGIAGNKVRWAGTTPEERSAFMRKMALARVAKLKAQQAVLVNETPRETKRRKQREYYAANKEAIRERQKAYEAQKRAEKRQRLWWEQNHSNGAQPPAPEPAQHTAPVEQAQPCKLSECPCCGTRFYMVKGTSS